MKAILIRLLLAAAATLVAFTLAPRLYAQQPDEDPSPNKSQPKTQERPAPPPSPHEGKAKTPSGEPETQDVLAFTGIVERNQDEIVLNDPVTKSVYKFDDPAKAQMYLGKKVKVIGKLGMNSNTIQATSIEVIPDRSKE